MKALYISSLMSNRKYNELFSITNGKLYHSIQKFHSSIILGLKENGINDIEVLSGMPISKRHTSKKIFKYQKDNENGIIYKSMPFINIPILKQIIIVLSMIFYIIKWAILTKGKERIIITDAAYISVNPIVIFLKKLFDIKCITIVADIYDYMSDDIEKNKKRSIIRKISDNFSKYTFNNYDGYILLTEKMNEIVNKKNKPYIVMEGILNVSDYTTNEVNKNKIKNIIYSGSLDEKFGIKNLINEFSKVKNKDVELHIYGSGNSENYVKECSKKDKRIKYFGLIKSDELSKIQKKAFLLINPRSNEEEYTKYSFPSKTMEYMASGTPVLMYELDGVPKEYYKYIYKIEKSISFSIEKILKINEKELNIKGTQAQKFVFENKNHKIQAKKIFDLIRQVLNIKKISKPTNSKLFNIYLTILPILFIFLSKNTLYSLLLIGIEKAQILLFIVCIPLFIIYFIRLINNQCSRRNLIIFGIFVLFICLSIIINKNFELINFSFLFIIASAFTYSQLIDLNKFFKIYLRIIIYLCITSLICEYLVLPAIIKFNLFEYFKNTILYMENSVGTPFLNLGVSFVVYSDHYIRNFSIFTEPSYFQFYLIFAFAIVYFKQTDKLKIFKLILLAITLLSTFSASAYVSIVFFLPYFIYDIYNIRYAIWGFIRYGSIILFLIGYFLYIRSNMFKYFIEYSIAKIFTKNDSMSSRSSSLKNAITNFFESPLIGNSTASVLDAGIVSNSLPTLMSLYGIIPGIYLVYYVYKCAVNFNDKKYLPLFIFGAIMVSSNLHIFIFISSFWMIIFSGIMERE